MIFEKPVTKKDKAVLKKIKTLPCCVCGWAVSDSHHIKTVKTGGPDAEWNLVPLCRGHHTAIHRCGVISFCELHPIFYAVLCGKGWYFEDHKLRHPNLMTKIGNA